MQNTESNNTIKNVLVDEPITTEEQERLNRKEFAKLFAETLLGHTEPSCLIAALYGPWGSGKSSLLYLIENHLRNSSPARSDNIIIRFNPWNISSLDQLIAMFFHELKVAVQGKQTIAKLRDSTIKLLDVFSGILTVGQLSPVGNQYFALGIEATKKISGTLKEARNKSLVKVKEELEEQLSKTAKRVFILIDDVDRLDQDAMKLLFRMIRLNADFKNTTYLLAFDPKIVEDLLDIEQPKHGREYLEKIIQLPINIPSIDEAILIEILTQELDKFIGKFDESKFDKDLWQELVTSGRFFKFFRTIRDVVRYVNGLKLTYSLVFNNVNLVDFMALEAIRIFAADSYDLIRRNKSLLTRLGTRGSLGQDENIEEAKKVLSHIFNPKRRSNGELTEIEGRSAIVEATCRVMFPQLGRIYSNVTYGSGTEQTWRQEKRICAEDIFDNYFLLGVPMGEISDEEIRTILARSNNYLSLVEALNELFERRRRLGSRFLERVEDYLDKIPIANIEETVVALFEIEERVVSEPRVMLGTSADLQTARLVYLLIKRIEEKEKRKQVIINAISRASKTFLPVYFVALITPDENGKGSRIKALQELGFSSEDLRELQSSCISKIQASAASSVLSKSPHLGMLLFRWLDWGVEDEVKEYVRKLADTDEGVVDLLVGFSSEVLSSGGRRHVEINKDNVAKFVDINSIEKKVNSIKETKLDQLNEPQRESVEAFLRGGGLFDNI